MWGHGLPDRQGRLDIDRAGLLFVQDEMEKGATRQRLREEYLLTNGLCQAQPPADQCETGSRRGTASQQAGGKCRKRSTMSW